MIKPQTYTIDNTLFFTEGQKEKEQDKIADEARKAENDKKAQQAKAEAENQEKTKKKKGLLNSVINKL
ncbi:hypothetical protein [Flavobacterium sp.]|uniref:hypothetical protein n=1 Tax=Flavobacterium sp. TaxID=239 RepID=UPI0039E3DD23